MTDEQKEIYRKVFEEDKKRRQDLEEKYKQEAIRRCDAGIARPHDWRYYYEVKGITDNDKRTKIAHQDEKIAHPDSMRKAPATILLVAGMIGSLIFKQWYLIWAILFWWYFNNDRV